MSSLGKKDLKVRGLALRAEKGATPGAPIGTCVPCLETFSMRFVRMEYPSAGWTGPPHRNFAGGPVKPVLSPITYAELGEFSWSNPTPELLVIPYWRSMPRLALSSMTRSLN